MEKLNSVKSKISDDKLKNEITNLFSELETLHKELVATNPARISGEIRLAEKVADIYSGIISYSGKPTDSQIQGLNLYNGVYVRYRDEMNKILNEYLATSSCNIP